MVIQVASGFQRGRGGLRAGRVVAGFGRFREDDRFVIHSVGVIDDLYPCDMDGPGAYESMEPVNER